MKVPAPVRRAVALSLTVAGALAFLAPLLTRVTLGHAFFLTGRGKLANFETTVEFFAAQGIPMPELNAAFVSRLEYYGGALLVIGLLTRVVSLLLAGTMAVALLQERQQFLASWLPTGEVGPTDIAPWVFLVLLLWLVLHGPGAASLDRLLAGWLREEEPEAAAVEPARAA
ncbi:MAG TPA: DoxX family protein [Vicinamibacteria bacterium]|nr:DoxX family protein [Vicinamibacteria bacterium]